MTSAINPNINVSYPLPGQNNSSQGLRDNFTAINGAFTTAANEITDLQDKVLLKSALTGTALNNDMNNNLILNAQTLGFRASTYEISSNLIGTVEVDCTMGDVQYGTIQTAGSAGVITLSFSKWAPAGTQASVQVILTVSPGNRINIPNNVSIGADTIEGYNFNAGAPYVIIPADVTQVHWVFNTIDCGTTVEIAPINNPRVARRIKAGAPTHNYGAPGDSRGAIMVDSSYLYVCLNDYVGPGTPIWSRTLLGAPNSW